MDVRSQDEFIKGFVPNSLFIGLNGTFAMWVGAIIEDINQKIVLITPEGKEEETIMRLSRVGYDGAVGFLNGGTQTYTDAGNTLKTITSISAEKLSESLDTVNVVDVRKPGEFDAEHLADAKHYPLDYMNAHLSELDKNKEYHLHCAGGYRSIIAISLLMKNGYSKLIDIDGGFGAISETNIPTTEFVCPSTLK